MHSWSKHGTVAHCKHDPDGNDVFGKDSDSAAQRKTHLVASLEGNLIKGNRPTRVSQSITCSCTETKTYHLLATHGNDPLRITMNKLNGKCFEGVSVLDVSLDRLLKFLIAK